MRPEEIVPFKVEVSETVLSDLKERLARTRLPDRPPGVGWDYGAELSFSAGFHDARHGGTAA